MGVFSTLLELLFPDRCMICRSILPPGKKTCCGKCQKALPEGEQTISGGVLGRCVAALPYEGGVRDSIVRFKFKNRPGYATEFGRILADCVRRNLAGQYDLITWIPVSEERLKKRGYDQAMLLAMATALELGDVAVETLRKQLDNAAQSGLDRAQRQDNVRGAYMVPDRELVEGKRILLIDDVVTTGATLEEAARVLRSAGAKDVLGAALAHPTEKIHDT